MEKSGLKKPRSLEDLSLPDREVCGFLSSLGVLFNTADLIKNKFHPKFLKAHIGTCLCLYLPLLVYLFLVACYVDFSFLCFVAFLCRYGA